MYRYTTLRPAIAMIELIFALVVMGIVLTSAPLLVSQASKSNTVALQQESIAIAAAHTNTLMTYAWDDQNNEPAALTSIIDTNSSSLLERNVTTSLYRSTTLKFPTARLRRFSSTEHNASTILGSEGNYSDDVDDFHGSTKRLILQTGGEAGAYIDTNITLKTSVQYGRDTTPSYDSGNGIFAFSKPFNLVAVAGTSNIKLITTQLATNAVADELQKNIKMQAFICNMGGAQPISRGGY
jgi:Tfp pilus assembly protein PilV